MLRALGNTRQIPGEPRRSWFFGESLDLVVWFDPAGAPCGFQLAYDKDWGEHSFAWHWQRGYCHYAVSDRREFGRCDTPFLEADGPFPRDRVLPQFEANATEMPAEIAGFVVDKLKSYAGPRRIGR